MIKELKDPANAITALGLVISVVAINLAILGHSEIAVATALWALLADHLDGVVAKKTKNRAAITGQVGKSLDSLADLVSAGIFPGVLVATMSDGAIWAVAAAVILALASALRLSYFNSVGLKGGFFIGVPTTYALPVVGAVFLVRPLISEQIFPIVLAAALVVVAALHVSKLRVPAAGGAMYVVITAYSVATSALLTLRVV